MESSEWSENIVSYIIINKYDQELALTRHFAFTHRAPGTRSGALLVTALRECKVKKEDDKITSQTVVIVDKKSAKN